MGKGPNYSKPDCKDARGYPERKNNQRSKALKLKKGSMGGSHNK